MISDKMEKYLGKSYKKPAPDFDEVLDAASKKAEKEQAKNKKGLGESEDTVGTMAYNNYSSQYGDVGVGDKGTQPLRVGRSSPSMSSRQRSWNLGFVSDVLDAEGLLSGNLRREIAVRLHKLG
jgi:hypothetical protein